MECFQCLISILFLFLVQQLKWCVCENHTGTQQREKSFQLLRFCDYRKTYLSGHCYNSKVLYFAIFEMFTMFYSLYPVAVILFKSYPSASFQLLCPFRWTLFFQGTILPQNQWLRMLSGAILWNSSYVLVLLMHQSFLSISLHISMKYRD